MAIPIRPSLQAVTPLERTGMQSLRVGNLGSVGESGGASFGDVFKKALDDTSNLQTDAQNTIAAYLRGEPVELHQVMAASEEASISLELLVEVRNKLTEAYRAIMNVS
ncbi:MAG: flagellar hook-basal body complex protein FliE [Candidatus Eiseniibacteriota bacterium]